MKKVGIMGGTFNPIHFGHLFLADYAFDWIGLDQMLFMPSYQPPHKNQAEVIHSEHRVNMTRLAIEDNPNFELSAVEVERTGKTYTSETLAILKKENPDTEYYFIIGADSLMMLQTWHRPDIISKLCTLVVGGRDHITREQLELQGAYLNRKYGSKIILMDMPTIDISSADIRGRMVEGKSTRYYMPEKVQSYIAEHGLYSNI